MDIQQYWLEAKETTPYSLENMIYRCVDLIFSYRDIHVITVFTSQ